MKKTLLSHHLLVLNAGSATLKWALFEKEGLTEIGRGIIERIGEKGSFAEWRLWGKLGIKHLSFSHHRQAVAYVVKMLAWHKLLTTVKLVGHRIVHGGELFIQPTILTSKIIKQLSVLNNLAPLHNPVELSTIKTACQLMSQVKHIATFDTSWFAHLPEESRIYPLPSDLALKYSLRRYGFHGLSHSYVTAEASRILSKPQNQINLITCHLGSGSSVAAIRAGKPIDTSMGFTPLEGLMMCQRSGDLDPGLLIYLLKQPGMSLKKLEQILNYESGLRALAGVSDMREVLTRAGYEVLGFRSSQKVSPPEQAKARLALNVYLYRLQKYIGAYAAILGNVDAIVFTGGIGERNEVIRNLTMRGLPKLKDVPVLAIPTNEELAIAKQIVNV